MRAPRRKKRPQFMLTAPRQIALEHLAAASRPLPQGLIMPGYHNAPRTLQTIVKFGWAAVHRAGRRSGMTYVITDKGREMVS